MPITYANVAVSADGYMAALDQTLEIPFGTVEGQAPDWVLPALMGWRFKHPDESKSEVDRIVDAGAFVMGRNMFGPDRGEPDLAWQGWWGPNPPYHGPVFVLTHHARPDLEMEGGTTFHFVTEGIEVALERARAAAGDRDISIAGGATTINQFLAAGLLDELRLHVSPSILGAGERLFDGVPAMELEQVSSKPGPLVTHVTYRVVKP